MTKDPTGGVARPGEPDTRDPAVHSAAADLAETFAAQAVATGHPRRRWPRTVAVAVAAVLSVVVLLLAAVNLFPAGSSVVTLGGAEAWASIGPHLVLASVLAVATPTRLALAPCQIGWLDSNEWSTGSGGPTRRNGPGSAT